MLDLTFGEQVKIILSRRGMTIKELAELIEKHAGKKMSRQNLTQRLGRDNFQEQDMRMIAEILDCPFHLNILDDTITTEKVNSIEEGAEVLPEYSETAVQAPASDSDRTVPERDITIGELVDIHEELDAIAKAGASEAVPIDGEPQEQPEDESGEVAETAADTETVVDAPTEETTEAAKAADTGKAKPEKAVKDKAEMLMSELRAEEKLHALMSYFKRKKKKNPEREQAREVTEEGENSDELLVRPQSELDENYKTVLNELLEEVSPQEFYGVEEKEGQAYGAEAYGTDGYEEYAGEFPAPEEVEDLENGDVNPYTGHEYESNSVRMHPTRIGYVQVYDRVEHAWTDMTEWAFLGYQERKKALLGKDYDPPIYLD